MSTVDTNVEKSGEMILQYSLGLGTKGLVFKAKAHPTIEELVRGWGSGAKQPSRSFGSGWNLLTETKKPEDGLMVWNLNQNPGVIRIGPLSLRIDQPAAPFVSINNGDGTDVINLSFLRIVGISEGTGVEFYIKGVFSNSGTRALNEKIRNAVRGFYQEYLKPIELITYVEPRER